MTTLIHWQPLKSTASVRNPLNSVDVENKTYRVARNENFAHRHEKSTNRTPMEIYETNEVYVVRLVVPGLKPQQFDITLQENRLVIGGNIQSEHKEHVHYHLREWHPGGFRRSVKFSLPIDAANVQATLADGILTIQVPKAAVAQPRQISVNVS